MKDIRPLSIVTSLSPSSPLVVAAPSLPAQASSALPPFSAVVAAPALARNIIVTVPPALAGFISAMVLQGLPPHTEAQALSAYKRVWCHKPIQRPVLIAGLNNSNQLAVHAQLCKSILMTQAGVQPPPEQKYSACKRAQQDYSNIVFAECISAGLS
ncbi:hypothetical protein CIHG_10062 [Coccidioides immitis H538.4]|uniref:Uncharacterized protein n=1 Tax=Coccidioides immitis H538.4 TaxID=396776 RepID=A0A0J8S5V3_COCIT|nr:hypothetical protein CIHG_10062 [Coccidioides immitis H538.4]